MKRGIFVEKGKKEKFQRCGFVCILKEKIRV